MAKYLKPQAPLMRGEDYVYPPTTADQVILSDGTRLEKNGKVMADHAVEANNSLNLGNMPVSNFATKEEINKVLSWIFPSGATTDVLSYFPENGSQFTAPDDGYLIIGYTNGFITFNSSVDSAIHGDSGYNVDQNNACILNIAMKKGATGVLWRTATIKSAYFKKCQ